MRITLLRSPTMPDPMADLGEHQFKYSFYPHVGSWNEETQKEAYLLNDPIIVYRRTMGHRQSTTPARAPHLSWRTVPGGASVVNGLSSMVSVSAPNVIIETVKRAEDGDGIIVRLYESQRKRGAVNVRFGLAVGSAWETNLLEENETELRIENDSVILNLRPYQIMTLRVTFK